MTGQGGPRKLGVHAGVAPCPPTAAWAVVGVPRVLVHPSSAEAPRVLCYHLEGGVAPSLLLVRCAEMGPPAACWILRACCSCRLMVVLALVGAWEVQWSQVPAESHSAAAGTAAAGAEPDQQHRQHHQHHQYLEVVPGRVLYGLCWHVLRGACVDLWALRLLLLLLQVPQPCWHHHSVWLVVTPCLAAPLQVASWQELFAVVVAAAASAAPAGVLRSPAPAAGAPVGRLWFQH